MAASSTAWRCTAGFIPFGGTFLTFSDYARNALRMAALMKHPQSSSCLPMTRSAWARTALRTSRSSMSSSLRLIPGLDVWRPCDSRSLLIAWISAAIERHGPIVLMFSRQNLPFQARRARPRADIARGGYVLVGLRAESLRRSSSPPARKCSSRWARRRCSTKQGVAVRVVSMPSTSVFDRQDAAYRESVLPQGVRRVAVEAGVIRHLAQVRRSGRRGDRHRSLR